MAIDIKAGFQGFASRLGLPTLPGMENQYLSPNHFNTPHRMLEFNLYWEFKAIEGYTLMRDRCLSLGDVKTAELFQHILKEEEEHFDELLQRYTELVGWKRHQDAVTRVLKAQGTYTSPEEYVRKYGRKS